MARYKSGDRVFHVTLPDNLGTVVNEAVTVKGTRVAVLWDDTGNITSWDPVFLFPAGTSLDAIPAIIQSGEWTWYKRTNQLNRIVTRRRYGH